MSTKKINALLNALDKAQENKEYETVAASYLRLGKVYMENKLTAKAIYYLNRFDNLVSGDGSLYDQYKKQNELAMDWIDEMQAEHEPYENEIQMQVMDASDTLNELQKMQWLLLTMARFCTLFERISILPDFEGLEELSYIVDYFSLGLYGELDEDDTADEIEDYYDLILETFDSAKMNDYTNKVALPDQSSFVPADLEGGDIGTYYFTTAYSALSSFITEEEEVSDSETVIYFAACGLLTDYYYRTSDTAVSEIPKIQEETARIFSDYDFVKTAPTQEQFQERIERYKKIMLV